MTPRPQGYREPTSAEMKKLPPGTLVQAADGISWVKNESTRGFKKQNYAVPTEEEAPRPPGYREPTAEEMKCLPEGTLGLNDITLRWALAAEGMSTAAPQFYAVPDITAAPSLDPKAAFGIQKPQLHLIPPAANEEMAKALALGAQKYGERNWLRNRVAMTTYLAAMKRHIDRILDGEDTDPESGAHHLGHVMAGCGIVLDAKRHGMLEDDRVLPKEGGEE